MHELYCKFTHYIKRQKWMPLVKRGVSKSFPEWIKFPRQKGKVMVFSYLKSKLHISMACEKLHLFPDLRYDRETRGLNRCEDSLYLWKQLFQKPKIVVYCGSVVATLNSFRLERIPYSKRYHWVLGSLGSSHGEFEATMREWGDWNLKELEEEYKGYIVPPNSPQSIRVNSILKEIVEAMHRGLQLQNSGKWKMTRFATEHLEGKQWQVMVVESTADGRGAFNLTNGTIVVSTRLLETLQTDAEVATLLGHEVAHGLARHALEELTRCYRTVAILPQLMFIPYSEIPLALVFSFYSRRREMEADYIGMMLMASTGYDPQLAPACLESHFDPSHYHGIFATHPSMLKRAKKLKELKVMEQAMAIYGEVTSAHGAGSSI